MILLIFYLIIPILQQTQSLEAGVSLFTGVCSLDGYSQAPMDGFMASRKKANAYLEHIAEL